MEQIAYLHNVNLRYGCFCNPGACRRHLGLTSQQVLKHYESGHVCGDGFDIVDGNPTGAIRASIGYMTTKENIDFLLLLIYNCWIKPSNVSTTSNYRSNHSKILNSTHIALQINQNLIKNPTLLLQANRDSNQNVQQMENSHTLKSNKLLQIFVYPIKSCAPFQVSSYPILPLIAFPSCSFSWFVYLQIGEEHLDDRTSRITIRPPMAHCEFKWRPSNSEERAKIVSD